MIFVRNRFSTALGDHTEPVVFEVPEAIRAALDELHFPVEAFGDSVVPHEPPHAGDRFLPVLQRGREGLQGGRLVVPE